MKSKLFRSAISFAMMFLLASLVIMLLGIMAGIANAGTVCRVQKVIHHSPHVAQLAVFPKVYYDIGANVRAEAVATYDLRQSDEYQELKELRVYREAIEHAAIIAQGNSGDRPSSPAGLATKGGDNPAGAEQPPASQSMLQQTCVKCHSGESPKGDLWLDGTVSLEGPDAAGKRDAIVEAIRTGRMPPNLPEGERLPLEKREAIEDEIYGVQVVAEQTTPPEGE